MSQFLSSTTSASAEQSLLTKAPTKSWTRLVVVAAATSFALGTFVALTIPPTTSVGLRGTALKSTDEVSANLRVELGANRSYSVGNLRQSAGPTHPHYPPRVVRRPRSRTRHRTALRETWASPLQKFRGVSAELIFPLTLFNLGV